MLGLAVKLGPRGHLHNLTQVHDRHPVAHVFDDTQVVGDDDVGQLEFALEILEQVDDLGLDGNVQGRNRLIGDDQLGVEGQRPRNADPLTLAAAELVGVAPQVLGVQSDPCQQIDRPLFELRAGCHSVDFEGLAHNAADGQAGVQ